MDRPTVDLYERRAGDYERERRPVRDPRPARAFAGRVRGGATRVDLGCGPGLLVEELGHPLLALDAAHDMLVRTRRVEPRAMPVQADLESLPVRSGALAGAWARMSYLHVARERLPLALADLHRALEVGAPLALTLLPGDGNGVTPEGDDFPGRFFAGWEASALCDVVLGAGFTVEELSEERLLELAATRARTLPDTVAPGMRVLVCGLNPSLHAADAGVPYAGAGNRFWPAAVEVGLSDRLHDPWRAAALGTGMTDLVKRATPRAAELTRAEFREGAERVGRLVAWLRPGAVCFVGLSGYRAALDRHAAPGWQPHALGGAPTYVMPSTSGLNTHSTYRDIVSHLRAVAEATA